MNIQDLINRLDNYKEHKKRHGNQVLYRQTTNVKLIELKTALCEFLEDELHEIYNKND